jgi:signal peptidase I
MVKLPAIRGLSIIRPIVIGIIIAFILRLFFFSSYIVEGSSMTPTLQDGNLVVINKLSYQFDELKRFDVIVFHANKQDDYVKRVIGLPGDQISYKDGKLHVNGSLIEETFLENTDGNFTDYKRINDFTLQDITGDETVPSGMIFVIGDNRLGSYDSRHFGFIEIDKVVGKVNLRYYPFQHIDISF